MKIHKNICSNINKLKKKKLQFFFITAYHSDIADNLLLKASLGEKVQNKNNKKKKFIRKILLLIMIAPRV